MTMKSIQNVNQAIFRQKGVVTVFVVLMLIIVMTILALTVGKFAFVEQETVSAEYRSQEGAEAAAAGVEYALAWLDNDNECENCVSGEYQQALDLEGELVAGVEMPNLDYGDAGTGYVYNPRVMLTKGIEEANVFADAFLLVESDLDSVDSNAESGVTITGSEQMYITRYNQYLTPAGEDPPPMVVNGCLDDFVGGPIVFPLPDQPAIFTVADSAPVDWDDGDEDGDVPDDGDCLDLGHMDVQLCGGVACAVGDSGTDIEGLDLEEYLVGVNLAANPSPQAWNYLFQISLDDAKLAAEAAGQATSNKNNLVELQPTDGNYEPFIHYSGDQPMHGEFGTEVYPVVLIVSSADCPKFNGGSLIYGYLYYEAPEGECNGMGGATVIGAAVFEGDVEQLNANSEFYDIALLNSGNPGGPLFAKNAARIPGTWRDW